MKSSTFDQMTRAGNYQQGRMHALPTGQLYTAEKIVHNENGAEYETMWAAGPDGDNLEIAQKITFKWGTTPFQRLQLAKQKAIEFLAQRDYAGDPGRR